MLGNPGEIVPQIQAGTLRAIAVSTPSRLTLLPDTPTFKEAGYPIEHVQLRGVVMPPNVPAEAVAYWEGVLRKVAESEQWKREYLDRFRDEARFLDSQAFGAELERTNQLYAKTMGELGLLKQ
jgi:putative tricarboxylic transport membrane protein